MLKRVMCLIVSFIMIIVAFNNCFALDYGDVDGIDGVTAQDAALVLQYVLKNDTVGFAEEGLEVANVKGDGEITSMDAALILQKALFKDSFILPVEKDLPITYIVKFYDNDLSIKTINVNKGATVELPVLEKEGYVFKGWYREKDFKNEFKPTDIIESDLNLYAYWSINSSEEMFKPTKNEIKAKYKALNLKTVSNKFDIAPSINAPYSAGKLSDEFVKTGIDYMNFIRFLCGLQEVSIDEEKADMAQHGAVLVAVSEFSHTPPKPSDMDDSFYNIGYMATSSSNISAGAANNFATYIQRWINDSSSASNIACLGHRRWIINPKMKYTAFGYAENNNSMYRGYSNMLSFDMSNNNYDPYDFIAYPSKGNFPNNIIDNTIPWSVSLNTSLYKVVSAEDINVKITKKSNGAVWNLSKKDYIDNPSAGSKYFNYNNEYYGINSCIIFTIGKDNISNSDLDGEFEISITGIFDKDNNPANINYTVNFFDLNE